MRSFSTPSTARISSVHSGPLVSTSAEENAVDRLIPQVTMPTCSVCPIRPCDREARQVFAARPRFRQVVPVDDREQEEPEQRHHDEPDEQERADAERAENELRHAEVRAPDEHHRDGRCERRPRLRFPES
jgi:hypothetical protein